LQIEKLRRAQFGQRSERSGHGCSTSSSCSSRIWRPRQPRTNWRPSRRPARTTRSWPFSAASAHRASRSQSTCRASAWSSPRPSACACCGGTRLSKLGEDVTETLEVIPRQWKVIQTVREKFSCRDCESISQPPAPFHVVPRGWAGPGLLAMMLFEKYGQHQPLNRQAERYAREGVP
jgi:transposase